MFSFFKKLFGKGNTTPATEAPYKIETPEVKVEAVNAQPVTEVKQTKPKAPAKKRTFVKRDEKPAAIKAPAKPRAPRAPKAK